MKRFFALFTAVCAVSAFTSCTGNDDVTTVRFEESIVIGEDISQHDTTGVITDGEHTQDASDVDDIINGYLTDTVTDVTENTEIPEENDTTVTKPNDGDIVYDTDKQSAQQTEVTSQTAVTTAGASYEVKEDGIRLLKDHAEYDGDGVVISNSVITVTKAGTYSVSGTLSDGKIVVDAPESAKVTVILNGASITCTENAPIYVKTCSKFTLTVADGTSNKLTDGTHYSYDVTGENEPNAALFCKEDMTINGKGSLIVMANYNNGIATKNDLVISDATITVVSDHDGIRGKDSVTVNSGTVNVQSGGDGIKSNNETETNKGYITINGGTFNISASEDGIQAQTTLTVNGGSFLIKTANGSSSQWGGNAFGNASEASAKALKSGASIVLTGGTFSIDSADDSVHSNGDVIIAGGNIKASSGDDGVHADARLEISGGVVTLSKSYEGLEAVNITISGGNTHVKSSDDGINGAGGNDGSSSGGGRPGGWEGSSNATVMISGGYLYINASGDGLDSNGTITMTGGTVIVDGPTNNGNGPVDCNSSFTVNGGTLIAVGSSGMMQNASSSSQQCCALIYLSGNGTAFNVSSSSGENIITYKPAKSYSCALISTPDLVINETYTVSSGGSCSGSATDGLYTNGTYSGGSTVTTFTQSSTVVSTGGGAGTPGVVPGGRPGGRF